MDSGLQSDLWRHEAVLYLEFWKRDDEEAKIRRKATESDLWSDQVCALVKL